MKKTVGLSVIAALVLTACAPARESRINPFNWFGRSVAEDPTADREDVNPLIPRRRGVTLGAFNETLPPGPAVSEVTEFLVERRPGGAILRAQGIAAGPGPYQVALLPREEDTDTTTLAYTLTARQTQGAPNTTASRQVTAAIWITDQQMAGVSAIRVFGQTNNRVSRR